MNVKNCNRSILVGLLFFFTTSSHAQDDLELFLSESDIAENVRGLIKPVEKAVISSQISAQIESIPHKSGERFKKGDILVKFDCSFYRADLMSAEANFGAKKNVYENNKELLSLNAMSEIDVSIAESEMEVARAERSMRAIKVSQCEIKAPYNGRVIDITVNEHENVPADTELLSILNDRELEIELIVPSTWLNWLKKGATFRFLIDETGETVNASISKIGAVVDPVSQTVKLTGMFVDEPERVLSGMSGTAQFNN